MRILTLDIESRPSIVHSWSLWNQTHGLNQVVEPGRVICFAAKWLDQKKVMFFSEYDEGGSRAMAEAAHGLLSEADLVVTYNGVSYDVKMLHTLMIEHGLKLPTPHRDVDLLKIVKKRFRFLSNKLQHVSEQLDLGSKLQHGGHELWTGWMAGDDRAIRTMTQYCKQDVRLTEDLFIHLRDLHWIPASVLPATVLNQNGLRKASTLTKDEIAAIGTACPWCGSTDLRPCGSNFTALGEYPRWKCRTCDRTAQSRASISTSTLKGI
jgi:hypothetical protein